MISKIVIFILILLILIFVIQNTEVVRVSFLAWEISMPRALMILLTFLIGLIAGWLFRRGKRNG
ncbi:MAG: LapA family protein [Desulfobacteraceae bacterium]|nr:LapA family protein [Desulfobacteraceae bacterium]